MAVYAYICPKCEHRQAVHLLSPDALSGEGPYVCSEDDGCTVMLHDEAIALTERQYRQWELDRGRVP